MREVKVEDFFNLKQGNMNVEKYSLMFSKLFKYALSLVENPRDEMSHFLMGVADLVKEERRTEMLHDDMTVARLMMYARAIEKSKSRRMTLNLKRGCSSDHDQTRIKKRSETQEELRSAKVKFEFSK